ncbi:hypothetical protein ABPG77_000284 [Micractinium sp. CCAP 211/92]
MFSRRYAGHLNLSAASPNDGLPLAPLLAFLGRHSELLVSPSDCGSLFIWDYGSARVAAVLPPHAPAASSSGSGGGERTPAAAATRRDAPAAAGAGRRRGGLRGQALVARGRGGVQPGACGRSSGGQPAGSGRAGRLGQRERRRNRQAGRRPLGAVPARQPLRLPVMTAILLQAQSHRILGA